MRTKFEVFSSSRCRDIEKLTKFKSKLCDLDYDTFWPTFVLLIFCSLHTFYTLNMNPIALDIQEIFTVVRKFKMYVTWTRPRLLWPILCRFAKLLFIVDARTELNSLALAFPQM